MDKFIIIGKITGAHGVKGYVKIYPITDDASRFSSLKDVYIDNTLHLVENVSSTSNGIILKFEGLDDRDMALKLKGKFISVSRDNAVSLPENSYFIVDLIGCEIVDELRGNLGLITDVYETGANYCFEIKRTGKKALQIPFINSVVTNVDIESKRVYTTLPDGLYELYEDKK